jgi:large subunit ribosomal protein L25
LLREPNLWYSTQVMQRIPLKAQEREVLGKKVKKLRKEGIIPGHVFGNKVETEHVAMKLTDFLPVYNQAGETGLIDLRIGEEKVRPVMVRGMQFDPRSGRPLHVDFYQVNLKEKVEVPVPIELIGEEHESVHLGETIILQTLNEVQVEALPTDLVEKFEVDITNLKEVGDTITIGDLAYDRETLTILAEPEEIIVKMDTAVTEEMQALMEEQEAEAAAATEEATEGEEGAEAGEGEEGTEESGAEESTEEKKTEESEPAE